MRLICDTNVLLFWADRPDHLTEKGLLSLSKPRSTLRQAQGERGFERLTRKVEA